MVQIFDEYCDSLKGGHFSSYRKNLGNKLFIYSVSRLIADELNYDLIVPENSLIRREELSIGQYVEQEFPFKSIIGRESIESPVILIGDTDVLTLNTVEKMVEHCRGHKIISASYFSKYDYIKPYKEKVRNYLSELVLPKRNEDDLVLMLRNSRDDGRFVLPDEYYLNILEKENFKNLYVSFDHVYKHKSILDKLQIYNPKYIEGSILDVFKELTSFNKIIACQGTFSFWVCFLSEANKVYWPITNDGPNSNNQNFGTHVNLLVDDNEKYIHVNVKDIYKL
jgi:hypothetical protein